MTDHSTTDAPAHLPYTRPTAFVRWWIRARAYFWKEVNEIRRQPLLLLSLVGGPLLVLLLFGASYVNATPVLRTDLVLPAAGIPGLSEARLRELIGANFQIEQITSDRSAAEARLAEGVIDVVQILPGDILTALQRGESPAIEVQSNAINPLTDGWVQYLAYAEVNEINKALLTQQTIEAQQQARGARERLGNGRSTLDELEQTAAIADSDAIRAEITLLVEAIDTLIVLVPPGGRLPDGTDLAELQRNLVAARANLLELDQIIAEGTLEERIAQLRATNADLQRLEALIDRFINTPPDIVVAPVRQEYVNIRGGAYDAVTYYAPGVLALLVQHTAITLGALALVRERLIGAFEVFRVAPVNMTQLLLGKYLGYTLIIGFAAAVLTGAMYLLGVPAPTSPQLLAQFIGLLFLLTIASLGIGFVISAIAGTDSQAIQLAMITLLLSIFFSGFFIALSSFSALALAVSAAIPMTHGVAGLQFLMLRNLPPEPAVWFGLALISVISFVLVVVLTRRQLARA
jgi:ABC-2 type transport system permease protein